MERLGREHLAHSQCRVDRLADIVILLFEDIVRRLPVRFCVDDRLAHVIPPVALLLQREGRRRTLLVICILVGRLSVGSELHQRRRGCRAMRNAFGTNPFDRQPRRRCVGCGCREQRAREKSHFELLD